MSCLEQLKVSTDMRLKNLNIKVAYQLQVFPVTITVLISCQKGQSSYYILLDPIASHLVELCDNPLVVAGLGRREQGRETI